MSTLKLSIQDSFVRKVKLKLIEKALETFIPLKKTVELPSKDVLQEMNKFMSLGEMAKQFHCSYQTISNHLK